MEVARLTMSFPGRSAPSSTLVRESPVICLGVTFAEFSSYVAKRIMVSRVKSFKLSFLLILNPKGRPVISIDHSCKLKPYIIQYRASIKISVADLWFPISRELKAIKNRLLVDFMQCRVSQIVLQEGRSGFVRKR